jgi:hypothetical protein
LNPTNSSTSPNSRPVKGGRRYHDKRNAPMCLCVWLTLLLDLRHGRDIAILAAEFVEV